MAEIKTCHGCKYLENMRCSNKAGHYFRGFQCSKYAPQNSKEIIAEQLSEIAENLYREAETVPVVTEQAEPKNKTCNDCEHYDRQDHYCSYQKAVGFMPDVCFCEEFKPSHDAVNSPSHYCQGGIECIDCIKAALGENFMGFLIGNVIKYAYRYRNKNGLEDLKKARWYLERAIKEIGDERTE